MAIAYSGGTLQKIVIAGDTPAILVAAVKNALVTTGWTASAITGGWTMLSAITPAPANLQIRVDIYESGGVAYFNAQTVDGVTTAQSVVGNTNTQVFTAAAQSYELISSKYAFYLYVPGTQSSIYASPTPGNVFYAGVPYLPEPVQPLTVSGATNSSPIEITTTAAHSLLTGDYVYIDGVLGNTAANGYWQIVKTGTNTFTLNTSTGSGAYTSGGNVGTKERISRALFSYNNRSGNFFVGQSNGWRLSPDAGNGYLFSVINNAAFSGTGVDLVMNGQANTYPWRESRLAITEPYVMGALFAGGTKQLQYQLYDACLVNGTPQIAYDTTTTFDGHAWHCFGSNSTTAFFLAFT